MSDYEHSVFISYAWGGEREEFVNQIDHALQARGIRIVRDKRDVGYKGSITEFMERIGQGDCIIVVISDKYLRSKNCMFELVEMADNKEFADRIFPILLPDAKIYDAVERLDYVEYWEKEKTRLNERIRSLTDFSNLQGIREELDNYDRFRDRTSSLTSLLKDMNTLTPDMHRESDFNELYTAIEKRIKESQLLAKNETIYRTFQRFDFEPEIIYIPEGPFWMGSPSETGIPAHETPQHEVHLPAYYIGKYPVTNSQYEVFIHDTRRAVTPVIGWEGQTVPNGQENYPVTGVTWYEALAYSQWLSQKTGRKYSLPNEAQWEKACRGGTNYLYPWGNEVDPKRSNHGCDTLTDVYAYPAQNDFGCCDLVGNVRQWTSTLWGERRAQPDPKYSYPWKEDQRNTINANSQIRRVVRGSSWKDTILMLRSSARCGQVPEDAGLPGYRHGFRVVMMI